jgi:hypothetical protein
LKNENLKNENLKNLHITFCTLLIFRFPRQLPAPFFRRQLLRRRVPLPAREGRPLGGHWRPTGRRHATSLPILRGHPRGPAEGLLCQRWRRRRRRQRRRQRRWEGGGGGAVGMPIPVGQVRQRQRPHVEVGQLRVPARESEGEQRSVVRAFLFEY